MPTVSLKTVYETLNQLAEMGEVSVLDLGTGQARFDPNTESGHHHLVCEVCGKVEDLRWDLEAPLEAMAGRGFEVHRVEAVVRGVCGSCLEGADRKDGFGRRRHGAAYEQDDNEQGGNNG
jgi:Fe2+ or Zn2+ uptake regulation protein